MGRKPATGKRRYFLQLAYNGARFSGWQKQRQGGVRTVQEELEQALETLFQEEVRVTGCGRTDTRVHARKFLLHFDVSPEPMENLLFKLNCLTARDIWLQQLLTPAQADAHARYDAISRTYEYLICLSRNPYLIDQATYHHGDLDVDAMNEAAETLYEFEHFETFSRINTNLKHYRCEVMDAQWFRRNEELLVFRITANRFVRTMVRLIVGTLVEVGKGQMTTLEFEDALLQRDRERAAPAAPPDGLMLTNVEYPGEFFVKLDVDPTYQRFILSQSF